MDNLGTLCLFGALALVVLFLLPRMLGGAQRLSNPRRGVASGVSAGRAPRRPAPAAQIAPTSRAAPGLAASANKARRAPRLRGAFILTRI